jgi:malate dehydrogenase
MTPHDGYDAHVTGTSNYEDISNSDVIIITAGVPRKPGMTREDLLDINLNITINVAENVNKYSPGSFTIVLTNPLDAMVYAFYKISGLPRTHVVGMAGALDTARFRSFVALETGYSVQDITAVVLGGHGPTMVPIPRLSTVGGVPLQELLQKEKIDAIVKRTREAGTEIVKLLANGSAYFSPAASAIEMAESFLKDKKRIIPCSALCTGEYGINGYFIGVPVVIGAGGLEKILEIKLTDEETDQLKNTLNAVKKAVESTGL